MGRTVKKPNVEVVEATPLSITYPPELSMPNFFQCLPSARIETGISHLV